MKRLFSGVSAGEPDRGGPEHPNLLFVLRDQMRGQAMGFLQEEPVLTPNLDRLATESLVLTQAISNYPVCSPCRGMLMTGLYPRRNHVLENCNSGSAPFGNELPEEAVCWSDNRQDPYQLHDIAAEQPAVVGRLTRDELVPWLKRTGDPWLKQGE